MHGFATPNSHRTMERFCAGAKTISAPKRNPVYITLIRLVIITHLYLYLFSVSFSQTNRDPHHHRFACLWWVFLNICNNFQQFTKKKKKKCMLAHSNAQRIRCIRLSKHRASWRTLARTAYAYYLVYDSVVIAHFMHSLNIIKPYFLYFIVAHCHRGLGRTLVTARNATNIYTKYNMCLYKCQTATVKYL